jgi:hypothetical protein
MPGVKKRELSSAGSEHLPYKQRVGGSNPSAPTKASGIPGAFLFVCMSQRPHVEGRPRNSALDHTLTKFDAYFCVILSVDTR